MHVMDQIKTDTNKEKEKQQNPFNVQYIFWPIWAGGSMEVVDMVFIPKISATVQCSVSWKRWFDSGSGSDKSVESPQGLEGCGTMKACPGCIQGKRWMATQVHRSFFFQIWFLALVRLFFINCKQLQSIAVMATQWTCWFKRTLMDNSCWSRIILR